jgi:Arc/MetJ family transcription regulator
VPISVRRCDRRARRDYRLNTCIAKRPAIYPSSTVEDILAGVTKHLVDIDDEKLAVARALAGTPTIKATVDRALDELIALRRRLALLEDLRDPQVFDFGADPDEFRASGWR